MQKKCRQSTWNALSYFLYIYIKKKNKKKTTKKKKDFKILKKKKKIIIKMSSAAYMIHTLRDNTPSISPYLVMCLDCHSVWFPVRCQILQHLIWVYTLCSGTDWHSGSIGWASVCDWEVVGLISGRVIPKILKNGAKAAVSLNVWSAFRK